jgi:hypothetical protein
MDATTKSDGGHPVEASRADAGADVALVDQSSPDAHVDYCASLSPAPTFCSDFDTTPSPWGWDSPVTHMGTLALDDLTYESAPYSLEATTMADESTDFLYAKVQKAFTQSIGDSTLKFDVYFETIDPDEQYGKVASLTLAGDDPSWAIYLQLPDPTRLDIAEQLPDDTADGGYGYIDHVFTYAGGMVTTGNWLRVEIDTFRADGGTGLGQFQVLIDGVVVLPPVTVASSAAFGPPTIELGLIGVDSPTGPWGVLIDNVTFDMR